MKPVLYRYRDSESVIKHMDGYTPGEGWEPLYSQDQVDQLQAQLVRQHKLILWACVIVVILTVMLGGL